MNIKNKKAQEADTLAWIVGTFILLAIMVIYVVAASFLAASQNLFSAGGYTWVEYYLGKNLDADTTDVLYKKSLIGILETDLNGDRKDFADTIIHSVELYFNILGTSPSSISFIEAIGGNINGLWRDSRYIIPADDPALAEKPARDRALLIEGRAIANALCNIYYLETPEAFIKNYEAPEDDLLVYLGHSYRYISGVGMFQNNADELNRYSPSVMVVLPYRQQFMEIRFREVKTCELKY